MNYGFPNHKIERALIVCSGPSAGPIIKAGLPDMPGVAIMGVNQAILTLPHADYWVCGDGHAASLYDGRAEYHVVVCEPEKYLRYQSGLCDVPDDSYIIERNPDAVGFVLDGVRLCKQNAGFTAVNLAVVLGAVRIAVLGFDGSTNAWFHEHQHNKNKHIGAEKSCRGTFVNDWAESARQMKDLRIQIRNGSHQSVCCEWQRCLPEEAVDWIQV